MLIAEPLGRKSLSNSVTPSCQIPVPPQLKSDKPQAVTSPKRISSLFTTILASTLPNTVLWQLREVKRCQKISIGNYLLDFTVIDPNVTCHSRCVPHKGILWIKCCFVAFFFERERGERIVKIDIFPQTGTASTAQRMTSLGSPWWAQWVYYEVTAHTSISSIFNSLLTEPCFI